MENSEQPYTEYHQGNYHQYCRQLGKRDKDLQRILDNHGYPPMWVRTPTFQTLILIILEQQVSPFLCLCRIRETKETDRVGYAVKNPGDDR
jgi:DNA-3-methyladenine glycosylase II